MAYTTIDDPSAHFQIALYTGNGGTQSITNDGNSDLQPDLIWIKSRSEGEQHSWTDVLRGTDSQLHSEGTNAQSTATNSVTAFGSDGFNIGANGLVNNNSITYAAWQWKAGTATSGNTSGSGTAKAYTSSSNATAGFSIVKYQGNDATGHTVPHGCGAVPSMIIIRQYDATRAWTVYHKSTANTHYWALNTTAAAADADNVFNDTTPSSSVFTLGDNSIVNTPSGNYMAYCFSEVKGFSKFGKFTANGSDNNTFAYCGFAPRWVMIKPNVTDGWSNWYIFDTARDHPQLNENPLFANLATRENYYGGSPASNYNQIDIVSNGFKIRRDGNWGVGSDGQESVFMAFAEFPFVTSTGVPTTAK